MRSGSEEHNLAMLRVAQLYYERNLTRDQIARKMLITRWKAGRLLTDARNSGVVKIEIVHPLARRHEEEDRLKELYGLQDAVVVPIGKDPVEQSRTIARAAAEFLCDVRPLPETVGVSWGRTLHEVANSMPSGWTRGVHVVQINGSVSRRPRLSWGADVALEIARLGAGTVSILTAPAIVAEARTREALESDPSIRDVLAAGRAADILLFSLGAVSADSVLVESGYLSHDDVARLRRKGAQGDIIGRFIDAHGHEVDEDLKHRTIGLSLDDVRRARCSIAVTSGATKAKVTRAALASGLCTILITDLEIADFLLESR